jgi:hypothetical protein
MAKDTALDREEYKRLLGTVLEHFNKEDRLVRERQIRHWRRLKLYWNNFSQIYWSEVAHDYRIYNRDINATDTDQDYYDRPVNVFRAFLETIIAALSIQVPAVSCVPDDADNPLDLSTSKAGDKIAELIYKHNNVIYLWLHALYIYCTEGMVGCYSYPKDDKEYGTYKKPKYKDEEVESYVCPNCQVRLGDEVFTNEVMDEYGPDDEDVDLHSEIEQHGPVCPECGQELDPNLAKTKLIIPRLVGTTDVPKSRICLECYGGLYIKVANYAKKQSDTPYLIFSHETHYAMALECYPDLWDEIPQGGWTNVGVDDPYEQYGRLNPQYRGEFPQENVTVKEGWLRPSAFNILREEDSKKLHKRFPDGAKVVKVNDICADYTDEKLDDCWTLTNNPLSDYLNHDPLGELLTNIQDITNDLISLTLQTIEHGIAETWADPAVVNFNSEKQIEAQPGTIKPTKPVSGSRNISESFYTSKIAALSPEVFGFYKIIQELGQFVSGALPSIFGGAQGAGASRTASEYAMSRSMALQRLQTPWKMLTLWWKDIFAKVIPAYMQLVQEDERWVEKNSLGRYVNVFIKKAEMEGKIGQIELEPDEKLPITDEQQADIILQLMQLNNQEITQGLMDPDNIEYVKKIVKIPDFKLPGEDDRLKQYYEITELVNSTPLPPDPQTVAAYQQLAQHSQANNIPMTSPPPQDQSSIPIDMDVDNHVIEAAICRSWLIGEAGQLAKAENPNGYKNILLHMKAHMDAAKQQQMPPPPAPPKVSFAFSGKDLVDPDVRKVFDSAEQLMNTPQPPAITSGTATVSKPKRPENVKGESSVRTPIS